MAAPVDVDLVVRDAYLVTFDDEGAIWPSGGVAVKDGRIVAVGDSATIEAAHRAAETIDGHGMLAMPGLIDSHTHLAQTMMKGLFPELVRAGRLRQPIWRQYLIPFESHLTPEDAHLSAALASSAMLLQGTTTFFDAGGPHPAFAARGAESTGIRGLVSRSTLDDSSDIPESMRLSTDQAIEENVRLVEEWPAGGRVAGAMALRQIMNCTPELITQIHTEAAARGVKVHTHLLEGTYEVDYAVQRYGKRPVEFLLDLGVFDETLHCAHAVHATPWDVRRFRDNAVSVAHCANNYSFGVPRALEYWREGVALGLGTDGAAMSQGTLDMFRIAATVATGQQHLYGVPANEPWVLAPDESLQMATRGGARALGMAGRIGQLTPGAAADVVLLRLDGPDAAVTVSPFAFLVDGARGSDVHTVLVDGTPVVRGGELLTVDLERVRAEASVRQGRLVEAFAA